MLEERNNIRPPVIEIGFIGWLMKNLFSTWYNVLLTFIGLYILYIIIPPFMSWAFFDANFLGKTKEDCTNQGACWVFIKQNIKLILYGRYPVEEIWRINTAYLILFISGTYLLIPNLRYKGWVGLFLLTISLYCVSYYFPVDLDLRQLKQLYDGRTLGPFLFR